MLDFYFVWVLLGCISGIGFFGSVCWTLLMLLIHLSESLKPTQRRVRWHHIDTTLLVIAVISIVFNGLLLAISTAALFG
jgi:hypothetical protein